MTVMAWIVVAIAVVIYGAVRVLTDDAVYWSDEAKIVGAVGFLLVAAGLLSFAR